jgi:hypothetical protein
MWLAPNLFNIPACQVHKVLLSHQSIERLSGCRCRYSVLSYLNLSPEIMGVARKVDKDIVGEGVDSNPILASLGNLNYHVTATHVACSEHTARSQSGHIKVVPLLLEKGPDVNKADIIGYTPPYRACERGHVEVVQLLLEKGADVNSKASDGLMPIHWASKACTSRSSSC